MVHNIFFIIRFFFFFFLLNFGTAKDDRPTTLGALKLSWIKVSASTQKKTLTSKKTLLILAWHHNNQNSIHWLSHSQPILVLSQKIIVKYLSFLISHSLRFLNSYNFNFVTSLFSFFSPLPFRFSKLSLHQNHNGPFDHQRNLLFLFHPTM